MCSFRDVLSFFFFFFHNIADNKLALYLIMLGSHVIALSEVGRWILLPAEVYNHLTRAFLGAASGDGRGSCDGERLQVGCLFDGGG